MNSNLYQKRASLTVEAALVLPSFLFAMLAFLYFIQIFILQEQIQSAITKMGLSLSKSTYIYEEFLSAEEIQKFDFSIFGEEFDSGMNELAENLESASILKIYSKKYLDTDRINHSCIQGGYDGLSFYGSNLLNGNDYIDIVVSYKVKIPIKIFVIKEMQMIQRVNLRCWTGYKVTPVYTTQEKDSEITVYVTDTGRVYHNSSNCSHIKLSVTAVAGIPTDLRNENGAKYKPCEACCREELDSFVTYYITSDGTRYHTIRDCSKIKRSVKAIPFSKIGIRTPCKRCYE